MKSMAHVFLDDNDNETGEDLFGMLVELCEHEHQEDSGTLFFFSDDSAIQFDDNYEYEVYQMITVDEGE